MSSRLAVRNIVDSGRGRLSNWEQATEDSGLDWHEATTTSSDMGARVTLRPVLSRGEGICGDLLLVFRLSLSVQGGRIRGSAGR